ncbi:lytic transglycosylase domain-containing protein [Amycolatopsis sp. GM8]|uniref:lytic transglycosylase domain-containing protein n=1 Tax=Amycolatopsis sp. GM8 TaxID=2896530 RepID=UPI001F3AC899|nr:hypothetical protein [Amycolatopsis sp. GM8]
MRRADGTERKSRRFTGPKSKAGALAAASLALVPFLSGGGVPVALTSTVDSPAVGADGQPAAQGSLSPDVLDAANSPLLLLQQLPSFAQVPLTPLGAPVVSALGIPESALSAYHRAEQELARQAPNCHISWSLLAAIGRIESNHARGGRVDVNGTTVTPILGPILDGVGVAAIPDTDGGRYDGDTTWDRAVGPMQFIPSTWVRYASDGANPNNIYDAALAAGKYLCSGGGDLRDPRQRAEAVFRYNHSDTYVRTVLLWADAYERGASSVPDGTLGMGPVAGSAGLPGPFVAAPPPPMTVPGAPAPLPPSTTTTPPGSATISPSRTATSGSSSTTTTTSSSSTTTSTTTTTTTTTTTPPGDTTTPPPPTCTTPPSTSDSTSTTTPPPPSESTAPSTTDSTTPPSC